MIVNSHWHGASFSDLSPGDCYFYSLHGNNAFAIAVLPPNNNPGGFVFSGAELTPWVALGGHPYAVLRMTNVEIRPDPKSLHFDPGTIGELISAGGQFYMMGALHSNGRLTVNLATGIAETIPDAPRAVFSRWAAGIAIDGNWSPFFEFNAKRQEVVAAAPFVASRPRDIPGQ